MEYEQPTKYIVSSEKYENVKNINNIPVLTANKGFVLGYTAEREGVYKNGSVVIFDDFTMDMKYVDYPFKVKSSAIKILKNRNSVSLKFMYEKLVSLNLTPESHKRNYISVVQEMMVLVPSSEEQNKIADFFTTLDERIQIQQSIVENLEKLKKGYMQKIFSQELRFKDENGEDFSEWEEKELGGIIGFNSIRNSNLRETLVLSVSNSMGFIPQQEQFSGRVVASKELKNYKIVKKNDFAFNPARINVGSIAMLKEYESGIISPMYICFSCKEMLNPFYLEYFINSFAFTSQVTALLEGSVRMCLTVDSMSVVKIMLPTLFEQEKIIQIFLLLDKRIETEKLKLNRLKRLKTGYLQRMFI